MAHPFLERLAQGPVVSDGAMGTMLHASGAPLDRCVEGFTLSQPDWVREIHLSYIRAGAEVIQTNTFGASRPCLADCGLAERVRDVNFRAVKLAREAREIAGHSVWIAGSVGPLGKRARYGGTLRGQTAAAAFREQMSAIWEAGADLLVLETFSDLSELSLAVQTARETTDLPIVAEMTFGHDGVTAEGLTPGEVARALAGLKVDVAGINCTLGPARILDFIREMHEAEPSLRLSAMPNAGLPYRVGDQVVFPSSPDYLARHTGQLLASGVFVVGGCCGTTPAHIRAMRIMFDDHLKGSGRAVGAAEATAPSGSQALPMVRVSALSLSDGGEDAPGPTGLLAKLRAGKFVVSVEVDPPRGFNAAKMLEGARIARQRGADAVNVADSPMARVRMGALALCVLIQQQEGIETILHFTTRDRSLMGIQADLIGAHALGVRNIIALTGDPPSLGDQPDSTPVYDLDSIGLVQVIGQFNRGLDRSSKPFGSRAAFTIAVACDPTRADLGQEVDRLSREGILMAQELLLELKELPRVQGVYLMPSFGRYEVACEVLDVLHD